MACAASILKPEKSREEIVRLRRVRLVIASGLTMHSCPVGESLLFTRLKDAYAPLGFSVRAEIRAPFLAVFRMIPMGCDTRLPRAAKRTAGWLLRERCASLG